MLTRFVFRVTRVRAEGRVTLELAGPLLFIGHALHWLGYPA